MKPPQAKVAFVKRLSVFLAFLWVSSVPTTAQAANVYQCKDSNGKMTITDKPCAENQKTEKTSEYETAADRAQAHDAKQSAKGHPMPGAMRNAQCPMYKDLYNGLDKRLLEANRRNDEQAKKKIIEDRRRYGAKINELGC